MTEKKTKVALPSVSDYPKLEQWLTRHRARCAWQQSLASPSQHSEPARIECWRVGKGVLLIQIWAKPNGWDIYTSLGENSVNDTLLDAERRCGIDPCCGEWGTGSGVHSKECANCEAGE